MKDHPRFRKPNRPVLALDECTRRRRERRMERTQQSRDAVRAWAERQGFALLVLKEGHHWTLEKPGLFAKWWPRPAKLALNRDYIRTFHTPHWPDVVVVLQRWGPSGASA